MELAALAWHKVDTTMIRYCWCKACVMPILDSPASALAPPMISISSLLHPSSSDQDLDPIAAIEDELRSALDGLEETGAFQS